MELGLTLKIIFFMKINTFLSCIQRVITLVREACLLIQKDH